MPYDRLFVTGATGFVGRALVPRLLASGHRVTALARNPARIPPAEGLAVARGCLEDAASVATAAAGCDAAIHLAAATDVSDPRVNRLLNVEGTANVVAACKAAGIERLIHFSSHCAGRKLRDAYGETKLEGERIVLDSGLRFTVLRPTMMCGAGSKEFDTFCSIVKGWPVVPIVGPGTFVLRPVLLEDVVPLVERALDEPATIGATYEIAGAERIDLRSLIALVARLQGCSQRVVSLPPALVLAATRLLGLVMTHTPLAVDQVLAMLQDSEADIEPARRDLGFTPRPLAEGLGWLGEERTAGRK